MARNMHPNSLANLKKGVHINNQPNAHQGRTPSLDKVIQSIPEDAQKKVYAALWMAISMPNVKEASRYISKEADNLPECGFVLQIALRELQGKNGFKALIDILDRLFGKPKSSTDVTLGGNVGGITVSVANPETAEQLQNILNK